MEKRSDGLVAIVSDIRPDLGYVLIEEKDFDPSKQVLWEANHPEPKPPPEEAIEPEPVKTIEPEPVKAIEPPKDKTKPLKPKKEGDT